MIDTKIKNYGKTHLYYDIISSMKENKRDMSKVQSLCLVIKALHLF